LGIRGKGIRQDASNGILNGDIRATGSKKRKKVGRERERKRKPKAIIEPISLNSRPSKTKKRGGKRFRSGIRRRKRELRINPPPTPQREGGVKRSKEESETLHPRFQHARGSDTTGAAAPSSLNSDHMPGTSGRPPP